MAKREAMRFEIIMDAGNGAQKAGDILITTLAKSGRYVFIEPIIPAEISPPKRTPHSMSGAIIRVAPFDLTNIGSTSEFMIVEHEILLERRLTDKDYQVGGLVLLDMQESSRFPDAFTAAIQKAESCGLRVIPFHIDDESLEIMKSLNGNGKNMYYLGMLTAAFALDVADMEASIRQTFKKLSEEKLSKNLSIFKNGLKNAEAILPETYEIAANPPEGEQLLLDGNTAISLGIIDAGIRFFGGYPITPASSIMHTLAKVFPSYGGVLHQAEDEIAAIGSMVGAYYAGVPAVTATSGPGLSLKQEFIGFGGVAEIPGIIIDVMRGGPSTGLPTRTEQTDLFAAAFGTHGDSGKVVISVSSVEDCFYAPHVARYITEKLKAPVIILSDYLTSVSYKILPKLKVVEMKDSADISDEILARFGLTRLPETIQMVKDNQSIPGEPDKMRRLTGLNTDASGGVGYSSESNQRSHQIRNEKVHHVKRALQVPEILGDQEGDLLVISWGSSRGALQEAIEKVRSEGLKVSGLNLKVVYPLPMMLTDIFSKFKKVITVEVAYGDELKYTQLATLLRSETLVDIKCGISNATGRPLKPEDIMAKIRQVVAA